MCYLVKQITINFERFCGRNRNDLLICSGEFCLVAGYLVDDLSDADHLSFIVQYRHAQYVVRTITSLLVDVFVEAWILQANSLLRALYSHASYLQLCKVK